jgi:hypothetical protein
MMARGLYRGKGRVRPYSRIFERGAVGSINELDGRTREARLIRQLEAELLAHLGGNPTIGQKLLIERICKMRLQLATFDEKIAAGDGNWTAHDQRTLAGLANAYRLTIRELNNMRADRGRGPSLEEVIERARESE